MTLVGTTRPGLSPTGGADPACMSYYLGLRHLPFADLEWSPGFGPSLPETASERLTVGSSDEILDALVEQIPTGPNVGLLLSGGVDSAILAALVRPGTPCYTIAFDAPGAVDETAAAAACAARWGLPHTVVRVGWSDYRSNIETLFATKRAPLHAIEVPLYVAARTAGEHGVTQLLVGNGADSTFGGMDKLLSADWSFEQFVARYQFADPASLLVDAVDIGHVFEPHRTNDGIDVQGFLHEVHGQGIVQAFENAIAAAGLTLCAPYEGLEHRGPLDIERIRSGEPKYLLQEAFRLLYDTNEVPAKVPFARPMDIWLNGWDGPTNRPEFRPDITANLSAASAEARWLAWCLAEFCSYLDQLSDG